MKKKLLAVLLAVMSVFLLVACSSETEKMEGTYYEYYGTGSSLVVSKNYPVKIANGKLLYDDKVYNIDLDLNIVTAENSDSLQFVYNDDETISFDGNTYVKKNSNRYKKLLKNASKVYGKDEND